MLLPCPGLLCVRDVFAVLDEPPPNLPSVGGKPKKLKKKESERRAAAEAAAIAASMAAATVVRIKSLDGLGCSTVCPQVSGRDDGAGHGWWRRVGVRPVFFGGGAIYGVERSAGVGGVGGLQPVVVGSSSWSRGRGFCFLSLSH